MNLFSFAWAIDYLFSRVCPGMGLPLWLSGLRICLQCRRHRRCSFDPWVGKIPWIRKLQPAPVFLPGESHGLRSLSGYSPKGRKELGMTEQLHMHACTPEVVSGRNENYFIIFRATKVSVIFSLKNILSGNMISKIDGFPYVLMPYTFFFFGLLRKLFSRAGRYKVHGSPLLECCSVTCGGKRMQLYLVF